MKALTFEEWCDMHSRAFYNWSQEARRKFFDTARQGMIEESFIGFKQKEDWPDGAKGFVTYFTDKPKMEAAAPWSSNPIGAFTYVRLDAEPAWTPKVGDAVFYRHTGHNVGVGVIESIKDYDKTSYYMQGDRATGWYEVKPFDASKIGKPWQEIPGGNGGN